MKVINSKEKDLAISLKKSRTLDDNNPSNMSIKINGTDLLASQDF